MAITANLDSFSVDPDGTTIIRVTLTDGQSFKKQKEYRPNPFNLDQLKSTVRNDANSIVPPQDPKQTLTVGPFDFSIAPLSGADIAKAKFLSDLSIQRQMDKAIALGLKKASDQDYIDQVALVKSEFIDPGYLTVL